MWTLYCCTELDRKRTHHKVTWPSSYLRPFLHITIWYQCAWNALKMLSNSLKKEIKEETKVSVPETFVSSLISFFNLIFTFPRIGVRARNADFEEHVKQYGVAAQIPAEGRRLISFPINTKLPGKATFQISCVAGKYGDASEIHVPVYPPPTKEAVAVYGEIEKKEQVVGQSIKKPEDILYGYGGLQVT